MDASDTSSNSILDSGLVVPEHVVFRAFEAETLLLNLQSGQYHGLNATGGRMLEILGERGGTVRDAVRVLAGEYAVDAEEIEPDLAEFCEALAERGLVQRTGEPAPG